MTVSRPCRRPAIDAGMRIFVSSAENETISARSYGESKEGGEEGRGRWNSCQQQRGAKEQQARSRAQQLRCDPFLFLHHHVLHHQVIRSTHRAVALHLQPFRKSETPVNGDPCRVSGELDQLGARRSLTASPHHRPHQILRGCSIAQHWRRLSAHTMAGLETR